MSKLTGDEKWCDPKSVKTLTLEHRMAASRMGFLEAFAPLYDYDSWRTSFLGGSLSVSRFFSEHVLSLVKAKQANDRFAVARIVKANSPRLSQAALRESALRESPDTRKLLGTVNAAIDAFMELWKDDADPTLLQV
jgi:DNA helicase-2/ATP-dependent DNA helicase PcrA